MSSEPEVSPTDPTPPGPAVPPPPPEPAKVPAQPVSEVGFTRAAALWTSLIFGFLILTVLLIFVAQNTESAKFAFLGWQWTLPLGVAILAAAVCGGLVAVLVGAARIFQLRRAAKKNLKAARQS
ncbi:lipopolysaccharide assembly LapA domain-containing protein [Mycobacterium sp. DL592]|uniref:LapA family protein n=1 Tax=Mycobacterium sp. DL592 TaxID=2675524 RepID=UPI00141FAE73|nr:lipopolysaccharide assembly protein LapA domain-containing protein [Mycobacterium sp. DL592]